MAEIKMDKEFFDIADSFISLVNEHSKKVGYEKAGAALIHAATRFSAFTVAINSSDLDNLKAVRQEAKDHFMGNYEQGLNTNLSDYEDNYENYIQKNRNA